MNYALFNRKHASLMELNGKVVEALQLYHDMMKEQPVYGYSTIAKPGQPAVSMGLSGQPQVHHLLGNLDHSCYASVIVIPSSFPGFTFNFDSNLNIKLMKCFSSVSPGFLISV